MAFKKLINKNNILYYTCDCEATGICVIKPAKKDSAIVVDVICPYCGYGERILIMQYSSEKSKKSILKDINSMDLEWAVLLNYET